MLDLTSPQLFKIWTDFIDRWPLEQLSELTLDDYNSLGSKDSFCYWLESKTENLGSIWGGSAFKFGIFEYNKNGNISDFDGNVNIRDNKYKWLKKYGKTSDEVFANIKEIIIKIARAASVGDFSVIDDIDLGHVTKWKIAFLYQDRSAIKIPCVYREDWLRAYSACFDKDISTSMLYADIMKKKDKDADIFTFSKKIWTEVGSLFNNSWLLAPGENACMLDDFVNSNMIKIGWNKVGDLSKYTSKAELEQKLLTDFDDYKDKKPNLVAGMLWDFCHEIKVGDIVFLKNGTRQLVGRGIVKSDYKKLDNGKYEHARDVEWTHVGQWDLPSPCAQKSLSKLKLNKCCQYEKLLSSEIGEKDTGANFWWLNANPKLWSMSATPVGGEQDYTLYNDNQHKRRVFQNFLDAQVGDMIIGYESTPVKQIVALFQISREQDGERIYFKKTEHLAFPIDLTILQDQVDLKDMEFFKNSQASLLKLSAVEYDCIMNLIREVNPLPRIREMEKYDSERFLSEVFVTEDKYKSLVRILKNKKNIILQGAPGVGKTFAARRLAYAMMGEMDDSRIEFVQFHQNYSYEDFVMGYKPEDDGFKLKSGIFHKFCQKAASEPEKDYFFIIDEINRGNMSKIFGELLMLIEKDYRGDAIKLAYSEIPFSVPENLHIIGMMNTADRSLAMIDYALRRRFSFFDMEPGFDSNGFKRYQASLHSEKLDRLVEEIRALNNAIREDKSLGKGFCIGHSYLCGAESSSVEWLQSVVEFDILPMLAEYWFDDATQYDNWKKRLTDAVQ